MKGCPKCGQRFVGEEEFCPQDGELLLEIDDDSSDSLLGTTLEGRYKVQRKLGEGGMGVVYEATHTVIGKRCAVKVLRSDIAGEAAVRPYRRSPQATKPPPRRNCSYVRPPHSAPGGSDHAQRA